MGRIRTIKKEPTTTIEVYLADAMLVDEIQRRGVSKPETVRKMFLEYFGKDKVEEKRREIRKKLDRDCFLGNETPDQSTIDNIYYPRRKFEDIEYTPDELMEMIKKARRDKSELANRRAADSIQKAVNRGDCGVNGENQTFTIIRKWF